MVEENTILAKYYHLLVLDNNDDQEKRWLIKQDKSAQNLSTVHFHILSYLLASPKATGTQIRSVLGILRGTLSKQLTNLIKKGLVTVTYDQKDARNKHYQLTTAGIKLARLHNQLLAKKDQQLKKVLEKFAPEQKVIIDHFLTELVSAEEKMNY